MRVWARIRGAFIDTAVGAALALVSRRSFPGYAGYLARRGAGPGLAGIAKAGKEEIKAALAVAGTGGVLRLLAALPPHTGERLFLFIVNLKNRRQPHP